MHRKIDIDDQLMRQAMRIAKTRTKRGAVEAGLRLLIQTRGQSKIRRLRGKVRWQGDLLKVSSRQGFALSHYDDCGHRSPLPPHLTDRSNERAALHCLTNPSFGPWKNETGYRCPKWPAE